MIVEPVRWNKVRGTVIILDQTLLPHKVVYREYLTPSELADAIRKLQVRGAPAIGIAGAMGLALAGRRWLEGGKQDISLDKALIQAKEILFSTRPTAVNLGWALDRTLRAADGVKEEIERVELLEKEAEAILKEDLKMSEAMGRFGAELIEDGDNLITHCNAGGLATSGYGTALAVFFTAASMGRKFHVFADETRPLLQGARLTTWELMRSGIDVTLICDSVAASLMRSGKINGVFTGADRIASNGDTANKIGTYSLAVNAREHGVPFYIVAPYSTIDISVPTGDMIPIEERNFSEVTNFAGVKTAPDGVDVFNPAFDVTPASFISGIITEKGVFRPPFDNIEELVNNGGSVG